MRFPPLSAIYASPLSGAGVKSRAAFLCGRRRKVFKIELSASERRSNNLVSPSYEISPRLVHTRLLRHARKGGPLPLARRVCFKIRNFLASLSPETVCGTRKGEKLFPRALEIKTGQPVEEWERMKLQMGRGKCNLHHYWISRREKVQSFFSRALSTRQTLYHYSGSAENLLVCSAKLIPIQKIFIRLFYLHTFQSVSADWSDCNSPGTCIIAIPIAQFRFNYFTCIVAESDFTGGA